MNNSPKPDHCLNCNLPLRETDKFCPACGQENRNKKVTLKQLLFDFIGDYFNFDSKFIRSIYPLLLKPGFLTNEYNEGRRVRYIPPLRMYFFISIVFFFVAGMLNTEEKKEQVQEEIKKELSLGDTAATDTMSGVYLSLGSSDLNINVGSKKQKYSPEELQKIINDESKLNAFLDTLELGKTKFMKFLTKLVLSQMIKLKEQQQPFLSYYMKNASIMMFFLMPLFALLLKLFYIRRKKYYIEHLTFSFHIHSFAFMIMIISKVAEYFLDFSIAVSSARSIIAYLLIFIYLFIALRKVYKQSWGKTIFKYSLTLASYLVCLTICVLATVVVTFLFF